jgi:imidazolonepropionase-like amidohydrolase
LAVAKVGAYPKAFVLRGANVLDEGGGFSTAQDVHVVDGKVLDVAERVRAPGVTSYDCSDLWLLPGFFDCHDHLAINTVDVIEALKTPLSRWALEAADSAARTLEAGVTFVRDAAGLDLGIKQAIELNLLNGPRVQISICALSQTGGHVDGFIHGPGIELSAEYVMPDYPGRPPYRVDGPDEMRSAVRQLLRSGADWIKLCVTGGIVSEFDLPEQPEFTTEEIQTAVEEAASRRRFVMVHAYGGIGLDRAVDAGVKSIEHGTFLTEAQARQMAASGCWLVPTLSVLWDCVRWAKEGALPSYAAEKALAFESRIGEAVAIAREYGVKVAAGSDYIAREQHGGNLEEIGHLEDAGMTTEEALLAATANGAELCGVGSDLGRIAPGYTFDAVLTDLPPTGETLRQRGAVKGVFKNGLPVLPHPRIAASRPPSDGDRQ